MLSVMPLIVWTALSQAAYSGSFVPLMYDSMKLNHPEWNDNEKLSMSLYAMIPLGAAEVIGGLLQGHISDRFGYKAGLYLVMTFTAVSFACLFATVAQYQFSWLTFVMTFTWGLQDSSLCNFMNCLLAFEFDSKVTPFSVYKFSQSLFTFAFLVIASVVDDKNKFFIYFSVMAAWAVLSLMSMLCFKWKKKE